MRTRNQSPDEILSGDRPKELVPSAFYLRYHIEEQRRLRRKHALQWLALIGALTAAFLMGIGVRAC